MSWNMPSIGRERITIWQKWYPHRQTVQYQTRERRYCETANHHSAWYGKQVDYHSAWHLQSFWQWTCTNHQCLLHKIHYMRLSLLMQGAWQRNSHCLHAAIEFGHPDQESNSDIPIKNRIRTSRSGSKGPDLYTLLGRWWYMYKKF